jgi:glyoxylase-like metal-dependent hydrolase (beta-lactamase superfamily II)
MPVTVTVGTANIIALSDNQRTYPAKDAYPEATAEALAPFREYLDAEGNILLNFGCYAVRADGRTVLVDTGWGPDQQGRLMDELAAAGIAPEGIDAVVFTHLHGDHVGWNLVREGETVRPRFPRARYLVPEADWHHYRARSDGSGRFSEQVAPLEGLGVMDLVCGGHVLSPSVTLVATPGHTPGHQSVAVASGGEHGFVLGDVVISLIDMQEPDWPTGFDLDKAMAGETRRATLERLERDRSLAAACHLPRPGLGRFVRRDGRWTWAPV